MTRQRKETRGSYYGINATSLLHDAELKLAKIRIKISKLQEPWVEADPVIEIATNNALQALDDLIKQYKDSADYLREPMEA